MQIDVQVIETFLVFCRIAGCLIPVPGLSTARVPTRIRLFLAVVLAFAAAPLIDLGQRPTDGSGAGLLWLVVGESVTGAAFGLISRLFIEALECAGAAISHYIGLSGISGSIDGDEPVPAIANGLAILGTLLLFILELPQVLVVKLVESYDTIPLGRYLDADALMRHFGRIIAPAFMMGLQISAPFLVYGVVLNVMFAILGRLVPQISAYFVSAPFIAFGGLLLLYLSVGEMVRVLVVSFRMDVLR